MVLEAAKLRLGAVGTTIADDHVAGDCRAQFETGRRRDIVF